MGSPFAEAVRRAGRAPNGASLVLARLGLDPAASAAVPPFARGVIRALLADAAARHGGAVFHLPDDSLALLCHAPGPDDRDDPERLARDSATLAATCRQLLGGTRVVAWSLPDDAVAVADFAATVPDTAAPPPEPTPDGGDAVTHAAAMATALEPFPVADVIRVRPVALLGGPGANGAGRAVVPLWRELVFDLPALAARLGFPGNAPADRFLPHHVLRLAAARLLERLAVALGTGSVLDATERGRPPLAVPLPPALAGDAAFAALLDAGRSGHANLRLTVPFLDALPDPSALEDVRRRAAGAGFALGLGPASWRSLRLIDAGWPDVDQLALRWAPDLPAFGTPEWLELRAVAEAHGPRLVLRDAATEAALRWGLSLGLRRAEGAHVASMLAASRMQACAHSGECTVRQCRDRSGMAQAEPPAGCGAPDLLAALAPAPLLASVD